MYIKRDISEYVKKLGKAFPIIGVFGPRQSGKTTLVKNLFPKYKYINLENLETLEEIKISPLTFLKKHSKGLIIDEAQKYPDLFSYLQVVVDEKKVLGKYIVSGSENYLLSNRVSQTLAGRIGIVTLLPFSINENPTFDVLENIIKGSYPRVFENNIEPVDYYDSYIATYIERDVRNIINLVKFDKFYKLIKVLANRVGNILIIEDVAKDVGIDRDTVENWISILKSTYVIFTLNPYYNNFGKRLIKSPKLYFYDTGVLSRLLEISSIKELVKRENFGKIFENFVITEITKHNLNFSLRIKSYFWRDSNKNEIDLILEKGTKFEAVEIKGINKLKSDSKKTLIWFKNSIKQDATFTLVSLSDDKLGEINSVNIKKLGKYLSTRYSDLNK